MAIVLQELMDVALLLCILHPQRVDLAVGKARSAVPAFRQFRFEAAHHNRAQLLVVWLDTPGETLIIEQFQQG